MLSLSREVKNLENNLKSLDQTLQGCRSQALVLMHMNDDIWHCIESNLLDCRETLDELAALVEEVKNKPASSRNIFRKPNLMLKLSLRRKEITEFQDKIGKSNASMQTAVGVVSLSLALRQNVSQEMLMGELQRLRGLVENTQRVARNSRVSYPAAARMSRNIEGLVQAATRFHSSASSTATTRYGGTARRRTQVGSTWGVGSDAGGLTDFDRDRIRDWQLRSIDEVTDTASTADTTPSGTGTGGTTTTTDRETDVTTPEPDDEDDDDLELDLEIFQNAEELGRMSFGKRDYDNAEKFLHKALSGATGTSSAPGHFENLKLQLSICYCFQAKWPAAEAVLSTLGKKKRKADLPVFHLLHAVALAHLADEKYDSAYSACKRSLQGKKKAYGSKTNQDYIDSLALLAAICEVRGEPIEAAAIRHSIPENRMQEGFPDPEEFIRSHKSIIDDAFGKGLASGSRVEEEEVHDEGSDDERERRDQDTGKEVGGGAEASLPSRVSGWDTGKEILMVPQGGHMTINPVTHKRIFSTVQTFDEETGKILAWADWEACEWIELSVYWDHFAERMIDELIVDEGTRQLYGLPSLRQGSLRQEMKDEDKWSDVMVVDIERVHDAVAGTDSQKEVYFPDAAVPESSRFPDAYTGPARFSTAFNTEPSAPSQYRGLGISSVYEDQPSSNRTLADDFSSNIYISEPRGGGVTSAPPLHSGQDSSYLSPMTLPPRPPHHPSRSVDILPRVFESNNPFRRAASQRSLNNLADAGSSEQTQTIRHMASFEATIRQYIPPTPWTARRYGNSRESPRVLQTPAVFLRDIPDGQTDGLILGVNLSLETMEVTVAFEDGIITKCPGTLYLNQGGKNHSDLPWFDCLSAVTNPPSSPPLNSPTSSSFPSSSPDLFALSTHPYNLLQMLQLHALQSQTTLDTFISNTVLPLPSPATYAHSASVLEASLTRLQNGLAKWIDTLKGNLYLTWTPLDEVVFAVPDALLAMPSAKAKILDMLAKNELFRHAKVTPGSVAVVWWFLKQRERDILGGGLGGMGGRRRVEVLVVQCGHLLTEMARYDVVSENGAVIVRPVGETRSELCGYVQPPTPISPIQDETISNSPRSLHIELKFAQLAHDKIVSILSRFKMRLGNAKLMSLVKSCTSQFRQHQLTQFDGGGTPANPCFWVHGLDVPLGFPGLENGQLSFSGAEVAACFAPVVERVVKMVGEVVGRRDNPEGLGISVCFSSIYHCWCCG